MTIFKDTFTQPSTLVQQSRILLAELKQIKASTISTRIESNLNEDCEASPQGFFKLNLDAALSKVHCKVGIGVIIHDWEGKVRATLRMKRDIFPNPFLAEVVAALHATLFWQDVGFKNIILEGDALQVVQGIQNSAEVGASTCMIMADTRSMLANFVSWPVQHIGRNKNKAAHALGKDALDILNTIIVMEKIPQCILSLL